MDMKELERVAALIGDPSRVKILWALLDGRAYTATELSIFADLSRPNISMHLSKLTDAGILKVSCQGRHRYYGYSRMEVAYAIEAMGALVPAPELKKNVTLRKDPISYCRSCYDHLAGKVGVAITDQLIKKDYLKPFPDRFEITPAGIIFFERIGIDTRLFNTQKRTIAKPCLDWTERRFHLAGSLGSSLLQKLLKEDLMRRTENSRALQITFKGKKELFEQLGLEFN